MNLMKGLENESCAKWLRDLGLLSLHKRMLRGVLIILYNSVKGGVARLGSDSSPKKPVTGQEES